MIPFELSNIIIMLELVIIEGLLSFDNALVLAALVKKNLKNPLDQKRALFYGMWGAYLLRIGIIFIGVWVIQNEWIKALAGLYLVFLAIKELYFHSNENKIIPVIPDSVVESQISRHFMRKVFLRTIIQIELIDLMFSVDSITVALAISNVKWVLITGAVIGILLMRVASQFFLGIISLFPYLEKTAFVLVGLAGINVILKLKNLNLGFTYLTIDKEIPQNIFFILVIVILLGAMALNKFSLKWRK